MKASLRLTDLGVSKKQTFYYIMSMARNNSTVPVNDVCLFGPVYGPLFRWLSPGHELELETGSQTPSVQQG